jgi:hypothetical protein
MHIFRHEKCAGVLVTTDQSVKIIHTAMYGSLHSIHKYWTLRLLGTAWEGTISENLRIAGIGIMFEQPY